LEAIDPGNPALESLTGPDYSPTQADIDALNEALSEAQEQTGQPPATEWQLGWGARGVALEQQRMGGERTLPFNAPTIDGFTENGVAVSIKSIDLNAPWYANSLNLSRQINSYVDKLVNFESMNWGGARIDSNQITGRVFRYCASDEQWHIRSTANDCEISRTRSTTRYLCPHQLLLRFLR
jgi:hypothetical protein